MRVYEAKLSYEATLFEVGPHSLSTPDVVYAYMKDVLQRLPTQRANDKRLKFVYEPVLDPLHGVRHGAQHARAEVAEDPH